MISKIFLGTLILHTLHVPKQIDDVMLSPTVVVKVDRYNVLAGTNSIREPIAGAAYDFEISERINLKVGGYLQDVNKFNDKGVELYFGDFNPIVGLELNIPIKKNIDFTTVVTPNLVVYGITFNME